jgi:hypothetical protein
MDVKESQNPNQHPNPNQKMNPNLQEAFSFATIGATISKRGSSLKK